MNASSRISPEDVDTTRADTDTSLLVERTRTDRELVKRVTIADADADEILRVARERADRLLAATRSSADAKLPLSEQSRVAVALLLENREQEDRDVESERRAADDLLSRERGERRDKLSALLVLERQATDLHLARERGSADKSLASRDEFLAQVSHDISGLMASQKIYLALLAKEVGNDERGRRLATRLSALVQIDAQMDRLVGDLVDIVDIKAGRLSVTARPRSAAEILSMVESIFSPLARERGQSLVVASAADLTVAADMARAVQVLGNLVSNAIKHTSEGTTIRVTVEPAGEDVVFSVADSGPGVAL